MNERIKQLAEQAGFETDRGPLIVPAPYIRVGGLCVGVPLEKFAELIVEECRNVVNEVYRNTPLELCGPLLTADEALAKHFYGVEE